MCAQVAEHEAAQDGLRAEVERLQAALREQAEGSAVEKQELAHSLLIKESHLQVGLWGCRKSNLSATYRRFSAITCPAVPCFLTQSESIC